MTSPTDFQKELLEWSHWKHEILINYLQQFSARLQRRQLVYIVDGFAGPGIYEDGQKGSPVLAAEEAQRTQENRWYGIRCINVEGDKDVFQNLQRATANLSKYVTNFHGSFAENVANILGEIGDSPALFFLDPIGIKGLEWDTLEPIYQRGHGDERAVTEMLVRYDVQTAMRLTGESKSEKTEINQPNWVDEIETELVQQRGRKVNKAELLAAYRNTFRKILGVEGDESWQKHLENCEEANCKRAGLTNAYQEQLRTYFKYTARIPIQTQSDQLKYYLVFATRRLEGITAMNDAVYKVEGLRAQHLEDLQAQQGTPSQMDMFAKSEDNQRLEHLDFLKEVIRRVFSIGTNINRGDLRARVAMHENCFGLFSGPDFTAVLGGQPRKGRPKAFQPLAREEVDLISGTPGNDRAVLRRLS